jgi:sigma-B regulation protein RsbU (phosphoserine phosphatase)
MIETPARLGYTHLSTMAATDIIRRIKPSDLPAPPQAALQIMRATSREDIGMRELSSLASKDPLLSAELLRVVNSPFYGLARKVQSVAHAVSLLGQRTLRNLALCISVRDALRENAIPGFDTAGYWEDSLRRAVSARMLAKAARLDPDECFTAGLLQDFGLLVMFFVYKDKVSEWNALRAQDPDARCMAEREIFGTTHEAVVEILASAWELPETLAHALSTHHRVAERGEDAPHDALCTVLYCADWMAAAHAARDAETVAERCRGLLVELLALDAEQADAHLGAVPEQVEEAASALGLRIDRQEADAKAVIHEANLRLAEEHLSREELMLRLEKAIEERDRLAAQLTRELELAREIQRSLLPNAMGPGSPVVGINVPARQLSGDFFDHFQLSDGRIYFNLADVSGKGVNAALLMAKTSSLFRCLGKQVHAPGQLLGQINHEIHETSIRGMFVTMIAGLYDPGTQQLRLVNAGHPPALLMWKDGRLSALTAQAPPLGVDPNCEFPEVDLSLAGGSLYLFSDGVTEGCTADGETLGLRGLLTMISEVGSRQPRERLASIVGRFTSTPAPLRDDITMLLLEDPQGTA